MYSSRYHAAYWLISVCATVTYRLTSKICGEAFLSYLLVPLALRALYVMWKGPQQQPQNTFPPFDHAFFLLVCLGSLAKCIHVPGLDTTPILGGIQTFLAFSALGALEPIRQNVGPPTHTHQGRKVSDLFLGLIRLVDMRLNSV